MQLITSIYGTSLSENLDVLMEAKGGKSKHSSRSSHEYEAPLGYIIEDVRPNGEIKKFHSAAYSNVTRTNLSRFRLVADSAIVLTYQSFLHLQCMRKPS